MARSEHLDSLLLDDIAVLAIKALDGSGSSTSDVATSTGHSVLYPREVANLAWAFAKLEHQHAGLLQVGVNND